MKVLSILLVMVFCFTGLAFAEPLDMSDIIEKSPDIKEGIMYGYHEGKYNPSTSFDLIAGKENEKFEDFAIELGGIAEDNEIFIALSYHLVNLQEDFNVKIWLLDLIDVNIAVGYGLKEISDENIGEWVGGATLFRWKI